MTGRCRSDWFSRTALSMLMASLLGCASTPVAEYWSRPLPAVSPVPGASGTAVAVEVRDARPVQNRALIDALETAIKGGIVARGFQAGLGGLTLRTIVEHHYFDYIAGFWSPTVSSEIVARIQIIAPEGGVRFEKRLVGVSGRLKGALLEQKAAAEMKAYDDLLRALLADAELSAALISSQ